jgi:hypothetical protein
MKCWQTIPKLPAFSTVEEYNRLTSYGSDAGAFTPEGELGEYDDANYSRHVSLVKYMQTVRKVSHPMTLVRTAHGDVIANEVRNGIMWLLGKMEFYLYWGDSTLRFNYPTNEGYEFTGLNKLIDTSMVVDAKGDPLTEDILETSSNMVLENYGLPTDILIGTRPLADLAKVMFPKERIIVPYKEGQVGVPLNTFASQAGILAFNPDVFLKKRAAPTAATSTKAPPAPTSITATKNVTDATGGVGDWTKTNNGYGVYYYVATFGNRYGESAPCAAAYNSAVTADTDYIACVVTNPTFASSDYRPDYVNIYRSVAGGGSSATRYLVYSGAVASQATAGTTTWYDINSVCSNTHRVFIGEMTPQILAFKQLAPMMKMDLAVIEPSIRWLQLLYGTPQMYATKKWVIVKNIGEAIV